MVAVGQYIRTYIHDCKLYSSCIKLLLLFIFSKSSGYVALIQNIACSLPLQTCNCAIVCLVHETSLPDAIKRDGKRISLTSFHGTVCQLLLVNLMPAHMLHVHVKNIGDPVIPASSNLYWPEFRTL